MGKRMLVMGRKLSRKMLKPRREAARRRRSATPGKERAGKDLEVEDGS